MKINEFAIVEPKIDEAPQGILKRTGLGIAKAFGSDKAAGKLETGKMANLIKKAFNKHLGASGREANAEELIKFLKINKYPTAGVEKMAQDMANKEKAKTMQKGPIDGGDEEGDDNRIQFAKPTDEQIKKFAGESVEEAELKGSQIDKLIMKAATDAYDVKSGYGGTGLDNLTGGSQGGGNKKDTGDMKNAVNRLKSETGIKSVQMATQALNKLAMGQTVGKTEREAVAPLISSLVRSLEDPQGINRMLQMMKQANKS